MQSNFISQLRSKLFQEWNLTVRAKKCTFFPGMGSLTRKTKERYPSVMLSSNTDNIECILSKINFQFSPLGFFIVTPFKEKNFNSMTHLRASFQAEKFLFYTRIRFRFTVMITDAINQRINRPKWHFCRLPFLFHKLVPNIYYIFIKWSSISCSSLFIFLTVPSLNEKREL